MKQIKILSIDPGRQMAASVIIGTVLKPIVVVEVVTADFWKIFDQFSSQEFFRVVIENPGWKKLTFGKREIDRVQDAKSQNVGRVMENADLLAQGFEKLNHKVVRIAPNKSYCKKSSEYVRTLTDYQKSTNEHARDAILMAWVNWLMIANS